MGNKGSKCCQFWQALIICRCFRNNSIFNNKNHRALTLSGPGSEVGFNFFVVVPYRLKGEWRLPRTFFKMKNIVPSNSY